MGVFEQAFNRMPLSLTDLLRTLIMQPISTSKEDEAEITLEREVEEEIIPGTDQSLPTINYSFDPEKFHLGERYQAPALDYDSLSYGPSKQGLFQSDDEYWTNVAPADDTEMEMLTVAEAQEAFVSIQYAAATGATYEVGGDTKRKFDLWIKFNPAEFRLFESTYALTREVNYA